MVWILNRNIFLVFILLAFAFDCQAYTNYDKSQPQLDYEKSVLPAKKIDDEQFAKRTAKYNYKEHSKLWQKNNNKVHFANNEQKSYSWLNKEWVQGLFYFVLIGFLIFVFGYLLLNISFKKRNKVGTETAQFKISGVDAEYLQKIDINELIEINVDSENYKQLVRLQYLRILQILMHKGWLLPSVEKTNYMYVSELTGHSIHNDFTNITRMFEEKWYGNSIVNAADYKRILPDFESLYHSIRLA